MDIPKIRTLKGMQPVTIVPDEMLLKSCLTCIIEDEDIDNISDIKTAQEAKELAWLLEYALIPQYETYRDMEKQAGKILRKCFEDKAQLVAIYPGNKETPPENAIYIGSIPDGGLYLI